MHIVRVVVVGVERGLGRGGGPLLLVVVVGAGVRTYSLAMAPGATYPQRPVGYPDPFEVGTGRRNRPVDD